MGSALRTRVLSATHLPIPVYSFSIDLFSLTRHSGRSLREREEPGCLQSGQTPFAGTFAAVTASISVMVVSARMFPLRCCLALESLPSRRDAETVSTSECAWGALPVRSAWLLQRKRACERKGAPLPKDVESAWPLPRPYQPPHGPVVVGPRTVPEGQVAVRSKVEPAIGAEEIVLTRMAIHHVIQSSWIRFTW